MGIRRKINGVIGHAHATLSQAQATMADFADGFGVEGQVPSELVDYVIDRAMWRVFKRLDEFTVLVPDWLRAILGEVLDGVEEPAASDYTPFGVFRTTAKIDPTVDFKVREERELTSEECMLHGGEWDGYVIDPRAEGRPKDILVFSRDRRRKLVYTQHSKCDPKPDTEFTDDCDYHFRYSFGELELDRSIPRAFQGGTGR